MNIGATYLGNGNTDFTVWAPLREKIILHITCPSQQEVGMKKDEQGFFHASCKAEPGCKYFFKIDGKDFPDPASKYQPEGVHGPSEVIDQASYQWKDQDWNGIPFSELILYELHVGTFTAEGTFDAVIPKLDHLVHTGINAIQLMPTAQFPGARNWGYDGVFPYSVQNSYGGPGGLKRLVDSCHQKGIAVFLDVVYNHVGPEGNYFENFGPYFSDRYKGPWGNVINFDGAWCDGVRDFFSDNAIYWLENFHIDGLRFDAIHAVFDMGATHFWELMHQKIRLHEQKLGRQFHTIAESDFNSPKVVRPLQMGGYEFTAQWLDDFHHALYTLLHREGKKFYEDFGNINQLGKAFKEGFVHSGEFVQFRKKKFGASSAGVSGEQFVVFTDNHDQAGNRATGSRLTSLVEFEKIKIAAAVLLLSPYVPMLFMGEEYAEDAPFLYFVSHSDPQLVNLVREGRRKEFQHFDWSAEAPDPQDEQTFLRSKMQWEKLQDKKNAVVLEWFKHLIALRKTNPVLKNFSKDAVAVQSIDDVLVVQRQAADRREHLVSVFNFSETKFTDLSLGEPAGRWKKLVDSKEERWMEKGDQAMPARILPGEKLTVPPLTAVAYGNE